MTEGDRVKFAYRILAALIAVGVVVQAASIAYASFALAHAADGGATIDGNAKPGEAGFALHGQAGQFVIPLLAIILFVVSFRARVGNGVKWAGFVLLSTVVQVVLGVVSQTVPALGWLHGINALVLFAMAVYAARLATASQTSSSPSASGSEM
jgi:hypothetical protein